MNAYVVRDHLGSKMLVIASSPPKARLAIGHEDSMVFAVQDLQELEGVCLDVQGGGSQVRLFQPQSRSTQDLKDEVRHDQEVEELMRELKVLRVSVGQLRDEVFAQRALLKGQSRTMRADEEALQDLREVVASLEEREQRRGKIVTELDARLKILRSGHHALRGRLRRLEQAPAISVLRELVQAVESGEPAEVDAVKRRASNVLASLEGELPF